MANRVIIIERLGHLADGLVPHDLEIDGQIIETGMEYFSARKLALDHIAPDTVVIERYESTSTEAQAIGVLVD